MADRRIEVMRAVAESLAADVRAAEAGAPMVDGISTVDIVCRAENARSNTSIGSRAAAASVCRSVSAASAARASAAATSVSTPPAARCSSIFKWAAARWRLSRRRRQFVPRRRERRLSRRRVASEQGRDLLTQIGRCPLRRSGHRDLMARGVHSVQRHA